MTENGPIPVNEEQDLINEMNPLCNWNESKGNPYEYEGCGGKIKNLYKFGSFKIELTDMVNFNDKILNSIRVDNNLKRVEKFEIEHTHEIIGIEEDGSMYKFISSDELDMKKPISVIISYPFEKNVLVTIEPSSVVYTFEDDENKSSTNEHDINHLGFLVWQIAKVYGIIYRTMDKEVGIWGYGFSDLYLERIKILEGNKLELGIGS